jgi:hypothetical protein
MAGAAARESRRRVKFGQNRAVWLIPEDLRKMVEGCARC